MRTHLLGHDAIQRERVARQFAQRAFKLEGVREISLTAVDDESVVVVTVLSDDRDMARDLLMQTMFAEATADLTSVATLRTLVYTAERAADTGSRLT